LVPGLDGLEFIEGAAFPGKDFGARLDPDVWLGGGVVTEEVVVDRRLELGDAARYENRRFGA
jgi:hypothetical protein